MSKFKWPFLILVNILPFAPNAVFYQNGGMDDVFLFLPVLAGLTVLNFRNGGKTLHYVIIQMIILACVICSGYASTYLYYHNVSKDPMTPVVGGLIVFFEAATTAVMTAITAVIKTRQSKNNR